MTMSHKSIKGYRALVLDYVNPYFKKYGTETDFPPIRGIYLYKPKWPVKNRVVAPRI